MDIYEYAMQMEKDGEALYRELAAKTANTGIRTILTMLAGEEAKHFGLFQGMKKQEKISMTDTTILNDVKNVFVEMKEKNTIDVDGSEIELYRKAQDIESKSREFYLEKSGELEPSQKEIFLRIADEEKRHYFILEKIIDFVDRPAYWLENPEWYHLEDY